VKVALTLASDYLETDEAASANSKVIRLKLTEVSLSSLKESLP
jgi:hypothetical protein